MARGKGKQKWIAIGVVFALIALTVWLTIWRRTESQKEQPNGFPILVKVGNHIIGVNPILQPHPPTKKQLQEFIAANQVALQTLRKALSMPCTIPPEIVEETFYSFLYPVQVPPSDWQDSWYLLMAEGKWHELEGRFDQAAQSYLDTMNLGLKVKGGTVIYYKSVSETMAEMVQKPLLLIAHKLSTETSKHIARELVHLSTPKAK